MATGGDVSIVQQIRDHISRKVHDIAFEAADAPESAIPLVLLELDRLYASHQGGPHGDFVMQQIWNAELVDACIVCLRCDYTKVDGGWMAAAKLAFFSQQCLSCYMTPESADLAEGDSPPPSREALIVKLLDNSVILARRIQTRYEMIAMSAVSRHKETLFSSFAAVLETIKRTVNMKMPPEEMSLHRSFLQHQYVLKMLLSEEPGTLELIVETITHVTNYTGKEELRLMPEDRLYAIMDELVYKLSEFESPAAVAAAATRALISFATQYPSSAQAFYTRYKGIRFIITRWTGKGFGQDQTKLLNLLDAQTKHAAEMQRFHNAANVIQRVYRGFKARKEFKRMKETRHTMELSGDQEKLAEEAKRRRLLEENDLKLQLQMARHRSLRETRERQLYLLEQVPAPKVDTHLQQTEQRAALAIQTAWRGHRQRSDFDSQRDNMKRMRAAVTIQRWARRCLSRVDQKKCLRGANMNKLRGIGDLTEQRRHEIQQMIDDRREKTFIKAMSKSELEDHFQKGQDSLKSHLMKIRVRAKAQSRRDILMAKLEVDSQMLMNPPSLNDIDSINIDDYLSPSAPVAISAKKAHADQLLDEKLPWYRKLDQKPLDFDLDDLFSKRSVIEREIDKLVKY